MNYINAIEKHLDKQTIKDYLPMQPGDLLYKKANVSALQNNLDYKSKTLIEKGITEFVN